MHAFTSALLLFAPPATGGPAPNPHHPARAAGPYICCLLLFHDPSTAKKQKDREKVLESLKRGDRVVTIGGMHGTVAGIDTEKRRFLCRLRKTPKSSLTALP